MIVDLPVGSIILYDDKKFKIVESEDTTCRGCYFAYVFDCPGNVTCSAKNRKDNKDVHFEEVKNDARKQRTH